MFKMTSRGLLFSVCVNKKEECWVLINMYEPLQKSESKIGYSLV